MTTLQLTSVPQGKEFAPALERQASAMRSMQRGLKIHYTFRPHKVDPETGWHGIRGLIVRILTQARCIAPRHDGDLLGDSRGEYITRSMLADDIIAKVRESGIPALDRYPDQTIRQYLSHDLYRDGTVGKFPAMRGEFQTRAGGAPNFYYLIEEKQQA